MKKKIFLSALFVSLTTLAQTYPSMYPPIAPIRSSDDRGLSRGQMRIPMVNEYLTPDAIQTAGAHAGAAIQFVRLVKNQYTAVSGLRFATVLNTRAGARRAEFITDVNGVIETTTCDQQSLVLQMKFQEGRYGISTRNKYYQLKLQVPCKAKTVVIFKEDSPAGQVVAIHQTIQRAIYTLAQVSDFKFWSRPINFIFPSDGDYYINDQVNLTLGHQWDVVAHEMGHAIYDQAVIGQFGGGAHKIDECYSNALALSEGWASFFAGWVHIDLRDKDAKFEYLVPRRAPIRFENVPNDVCGKPTNEWRVTSFFWDLIDVSQDGEISQVAAKKLWDDLLNARVGSVKAAADRLISRGWNADQIIQVWKLNFPADQ
ncbi:MAG: hypothetical protein JNM24_02100 [Bdellovibrionaceae bacterium]|nr:hypothetical protein [Pseudobdellovibrionaceae bacterium]